VKRSALFELGAGGVVGALGVGALGCRDAGHVGLAVLLGLCGLGLCALVLLRF
jgi:hypothetical protein